jgi:hypothetical protein
MFRTIRIRLGKCLAKEHFFFLPNLAIPIFLKHIHLAQHLHYFIYNVISLSIFYYFQR